MTPEAATITAAQTGRQVLAAALLALQTTGIEAEHLERAVERTAEASSGLYGAEGASTEEAAASLIHRAAEALQSAMSDLMTLAPRPAKIELAMTSIARTLALLYPVLQHSLRQRRVRMPEGALSPSQERELRRMAGFPRAPAPTGRFTRSPAFRGNDRRLRGAPRVVVEVEIGLTSESHIYTGLSLDISTGGVFVATYDPVPTGSAVALYFVLPDGHVVNAEGVVRWMRAASGEAPPGMGVAFVNISRESLAHIAEFCASRPPLYFDDGSG